MKVNAKFETIIYFNEENNFAIFKTSNGTVAKGTVLHSPETLLNIKLVLDGDFENHEKFGRQFKFNNYTITTDSIEFFLKKIVKTIPQKTIDEILSLYTVGELKYIIHNKPEELLKIKGIGKKRLQKMVDRFKEFEHLINLTEFLSPFQITNTMINLIYEKFKEKSVEVLKENPYLLTEIRGIGFKKADEVAIKLGVNLNDGNRLKYGILYVFNEYIGNNGSTVIEKETLINKAIEILKDNDGIYAPSFEELENILNLSIEEKEFVELEFDKKYVSTPAIVYKEQKLYKLTNKDIPKNWCIKMSEEELEESIRLFEKNNFSFGDKQKEAIKTFTLTEDAIFILAGYAGSGKTTTSKFILDTYADFIGKDNIVTCALSGNASNRIKNVTGYNSYTIHSLLGFSKDGFVFNESNPLPFKLIVLDEASMVDLNLFSYLINAIDFTKTKLFLIGDNAQLPPVGIGEVYEDLLNYSSVKKVVLDKVYRQKEDQVINIFAQDIRLGKVPKNYLKKYEDFEFIKQEIEDYYNKRKTLPSKEFQEIKNQNYLNILHCMLNDAVNYKNTLKSFISNGDFEKYISFYQVISPQKKGVLGTKELNIKLKEILNPVTPEDRINIDFIKVGEKKFSILDKVIHLQNKNKPVIYVNEKMNLKEPIETYYEKIKLNETKQRRVFNGQVGIISNIFESIVIDEYDEDVETYETDVIVEVFYPYENYFTYYNVNEFALETIDLAYAITTHKSQGSEYQNVIMPISFNHFSMLNNKLLYTAITRAKKKLKIFGETYAFNYACKNISQNKRNTIYKILATQKNSF